MKRILITGCNGFVGTNLYRAFEGNFALSGVDLPGDGPYPPEQVFSWENVAAGRVASVDAVIHLAGKAHDTKNTADPESYFRINLGLTQTIFDWFLKSESKHFIFFSSVKAVADTVDGAELTESAEPEPQTPYGQSKLAAEEYIKEKIGPMLRSPEGASQGKASQGKVSEGKASEGKAGKKVTILRPCMIHGPGNKGNLNELYSIVSKGIPWPLGGFDNRRTLLSIDNLIFVLRQLIERDIAPGTYQVADDEAVSTNELVRLIAETSGRRSRIWRIPLGCVHAMARAGDHLRLPLNSERLKKLTESYVASNAKLKAALGIEHLPVRAEDGLRKTLASFSHGGTKRPRH